MTISLEDINNIDDSKARIKPYEELYGRKIITPRYYLEKDEAGKPKMRYDELPFVHLSRQSFAIFAYISCFRCHETLKNISRYRNDICLKTRFTQIRRSARRDPIVAHLPTAGAWDRKYIM